MKTTITQLALSVLALAYLFLGLKGLLTKKTFLNLKTLLYLFIWAMVLIIAIFPSSAYKISRDLGMGESLNTLIFTGFIVVFIIIFKLIAIMERHEKHITDIVRKEAMRDLKIKK